jgi:hypothetical protein
MRQVGARAKRDSSKWESGAGGRGGGVKPVVFRSSGSVREEGLTYASGEGGATKRLRQGGKEGGCVGEGATEGGRGGSDLDGKIDTSLYGSVANRF